MSSSGSGSGPPRGAKLVAICAAMYFQVFLGALDGTVVASLLPVIASDLHELGRISWVATGYLVACAAFQPLYGKISDIFGRKIVMVVCSSLLAVGCAICGLASNLESLVLGRVVSGMGGGGIMILSTVAVSDLIPLRKRGMFQGIGNICFGSGAGLGGIFGGYVNDKWGWRSAFLWQVPPIIISIVLLIILFEQPVKSDEEQALLSGNRQEDESKQSKFKRIDFYGSGSLVIALMMLMLALSTGGQQFSWSHPIIPVLIIGSLLMGCVFVYIELYIAKEPIIPVRLFSNPTIVASSLCNFFTSAAVYTLLFYIPILFASVNGMNSSEVGQRLIGNFLGIAVGSFSAGWYMRKTGRYYYLSVLSPILMLVGISIALTFDKDTNTSTQYLALLLNGLGYSSMLTVTLIALIAAVSHKDQAVTTSIQYAFRGIGSTLGVAVAAAIFQNVLKTRLHDLARDAPKQVIERVLDSVEAIADIPAKWHDIVIECYLESSRAVLLYSFVFAIAGVISAACMREYELSR